MEIQGKLGKLGSLPAGQEAGVPFKPQRQARAPSISMLAESIGSRSAMLQEYGLFKPQRMCAVPCTCKPN
jgi:hypothetical protein